MIGTSIDQLLQLFVRRHDGGPLAVGNPRPGGPPFDTHLRQAESRDLSAPANSLPPADSGQRDRERHQSAGVEPSTSRSAENSSRRPEESPSARPSDEVEQRNDDANDRDDNQQRDADQAADAVATTAGGQPAKAGDQPADTDSAGEGSPAGQRALLAESAALPTRDDALAAGSESDNAEADGRPGTDDLDAVAIEQAPKTQPQPAVATDDPANGQTAVDEADAPASNGTFRQGVNISPDETADTGKTAAGLEANASRAEERDGRPQRETKSTPRNDQHSQSQQATERAVDPSAANSKVAGSLTEGKAALGAEEQPSSLSAAKNRDQIDDADHRDESPTETRPQAGRQRPGAAVRPIAVQNVVAVAAGAKLAEAGTALPSDATSESNARKSADAKDSLLTTFGRLERHGPLGARAAHRGDGQEMPHVDPARFISRVARAIHTAQERGGPLQLRLSPPELGSLRLELSVKQGVLTANIETDNSTARQLLLENLPTLRDRLAEQNVRIERFDVDVRRDGGEQPHLGPQHRDHQQPRHAPPPSRALIEPGPGSNAASEAAPGRRAITDTSINVIA